MKSLILALRLRVMRPAVTNANPQAYQPHFQLRQATTPGSTPGRAVIRGHALWQAITLESGLQSGLHRTALLVATGCQAQVKARMVVENREWMATTGERIGQREMSFEIHLPEQIGRVMFKPRRCHLFLPDRCPQDRAAMTTQYCINGAVMRQFGVKRQQCPQLTCAPVRILGIESQNARFQPDVCARRRRMRAPRLILQTAVALFSVAFQPFIRRLAADAKVPA